MADLIPKTFIEKGKSYHVINDVIIECSRFGCRICNSKSGALFKIWEFSIPYPIPPAGKKYKSKKAHANRGKTIHEICHSCRETPCYICTRTKCDKWMKEESLKGKEKGCSSWEEGRCKNFVCEKNIIKTNWHDLSRKEEK